MRMKELRWLFLAVLAVIVFISNFGEPATFGISQQWTNGNYIPPWLLQGWDVGSLWWQS
jgi:hypothetical protein